MIVAGFAAAAAECCPAGCCLAVSSCQSCESQSADVPESWSCWNAFQHFGILPGFHSEYYRSLRPEEGIGKSPSAQLQVHGCLPQDSGCAYAHRGPSMLGGDPTRADWQGGRWLLKPGLRRPRSRLKRQPVLYQPHQKTPHYQTKQRRFQSLGLGCVWLEPIRRPSLPRGELKNGASDDPLQLVQTQKPVHLVPGSSVEYSPGWNPHFQVKIRRNHRYQMNPRKVREVVH